MPSDRLRGRSTITVALLAAGLASPVLAWGLSFGAALTWPGYDPIGESISLLANAPNGWLQTAAFLATGLLGVCWAIGLSRVMGSSPSDRQRVRDLLLIQAMLAIAFAAFPTDPEERGISLVGRLHLVTFAAYAISLPLTLRALARIMGRDRRWPRWSAPTRRLGIFLGLAALMVPVTLYTPLVAWLGVLERIYVALPSAWQAVLAVAALRALARQGSAT